MDANRIIEKARKSISRFCTEECHAYCCRKGYLVLNKKEAGLVMHSKEFEMGINVKKINSNSYSLYMGNYNFPCPSLNLQNYMCSIHSKTGRPLTCRNFPIFVEGKTIKLSHRCLAVQMNMFYPYVKRLISMGYKIQEGPAILDSEFYNSGI